MQNRYDSLIGGLIGGVGLVVLGLWYWASAPSLAADASVSRKGLEIGAIRLAATAGIAAAQILMLTFVVSRVYQPTRFDLVARVAAGVVCSVSLAGAAALALLAALGGS